MPAPQASASARTTVIATATSPPPSRCLSSAAATSSPPAQPQPSAYPTTVRRPAVTYSAVLVPLIHAAIGTGICAPDAQQCAAVATAINARRPGLWLALVAAYRQDFQSRGITTADVIRQYDGPGHINDAYQEFLTAPPAPRVNNAFVDVANGGQSSISPQLYFELCIAAAAFLNPAPASIIASVSDSSRYPSPFPAPTIAAVVPPAFASSCDVQRQVGEPDTNLPPLSTTPDLHDRCVVI